MRCALGLMVLLGVGCRSRTEVVVFCAASLQPVLTDAAAQFERTHSGLHVQIQPSGSLVVARKLTELGMRADVVAVADTEIIDRMLIPKHAGWAIDLASNEIVLAHRDHSAFTDEITADNWPEILQRDGVRLGCTDPDTAPLGYRTRLVWELAASSGLYGEGAVGLPHRLRARCAAEHVAPDENELVGLLEARAIEYAFVYRSTAEAHHLKITPLPEAVNLQGPQSTYGVTVPRLAPNAAGGRAFVAFLLGDDGRRLFERAGFTVPRPAPARGPDELPPDLRGLVEAAR